MGGKQEKDERSKERALHLVQTCTVPVLMGALCGRLALDSREADARDLALLATQVGMAPEEGGDIDVDAATLIAHHESATALAVALIMRLQGDGRPVDAQRMAMLFEMTDVGDADYAALVPSA